LKDAVATLLPLIIALGGLLGGGFWFKRWVGNTDKRLDEDRKETKGRDKKISDNYEKLNEKIQAETAGVRDKLDGRFNELRSSIDEVKTKVVQIDVEQAKLALIVPKIDDVQKQVSSQTDNILLIQEETSKNANSIHKIWNHIQTLETQIVNTTRKPKSTFREDIIRAALKSNSFKKGEKERILKMLNYAREFEPWNVEKFVKRVEEKMNGKVLHNIKESDLKDEFESEVDEELKVNINEDRPKNPDDFELKEVEKGRRISSTLLKEIDEDSDKD
jgi:hypothetical protein